MFTRAQKQQTKARIVLAGPGGSGKTKSALLLAFGLTGRNGKIAVLDTEHGSAKLQGDLGEFDVKEMQKPFTVGKYLSVIEAAENLGYDVLIIDSGSHAWAGEGGILEQVDKLSSKGNKSEAWSMVQPQHYELVEAMLRSPLHIILTLRTKTEYLVTDNNGRLTPKKVGLAPVQREGLDYDFNVVFDLDQVSHVALCTKDRTGLFDGFAEVLDESHGHALKKWLEEGVNQALSPTVEEEQPAAQPEQATPPGGATQLYVTTAQVRELKRLIKESGADLNGFLTYFGAEKLERLPAAKYQQAVEKLEAKKEQASQQGASQQGKPNELASTLKARNIPFKETEGGIVATPDFKDKASQAFLKELGFKWDGKDRVWKHAA